MKAWCCEGLEGCCNGVLAREEGNVSALLSIGAKTFFAHVKSVIGSPSGTRKCQGITVHASTKSSARPAFFIQLSVKCLDRSPIYIDLHEEIVVPVEGLAGEPESIKLRDVLGARVEMETLRLAAKYWDRQTLSTCFGRARRLRRRSRPVLLAQ